MPVPLPLSELDCVTARLRAWRMDDLDSLVASANDESVSRGLRDRFPYPYTGNDGRAWLAHAAHNADPHDRAWALEVDGCAVGGVSLHLGSDVHRHSAELGYWLAQRLWNRGIMRGVLTLFVPRAMAELALYRVHASVYEGNPASMRVLERCGFVHEGVAKSAVFKRGRLLDIHVYARTRLAPACDHDPGDHEA